MRLTKSQLTRKGIRTRDLEIPGTGGVVKIRELSAEEAKGFRQRVKDLQEDDPDSNIYLLARGVMMGVIEEGGAQMFDEDDLPAIALNMSIGTMRFITDAIGELSSNASEKKDTEKSQTTPNSDLPSNSA